MKTILFIALAFQSLILKPSIDTLNKLNAKGQKNGYWKVYLDQELNPIDSANSYFYAFELYENGKSLFSISDFRKLKVKDKSDIINLPIKGSPELLNMTVSWYTIKEGIISRQEKYVNGHPITIKGFNRRHKDLFGKADTTNYLVEIFDFTRRYENIIGTYYYQFIFSNKSTRDWWFRKENKRWKYRRVKQ